MRRADDEKDLELDDADEALIGKLRALPGEGTEPDWAELERSIHDAVGTDVPRPWWRRWGWLVPVGALAATAAAALLWMHHGGDAEAPTPAPVAVHEEPAKTTAPAAAEPAMAVWLDGKIIEVDGIDPSAIPDDDDDAAAREALATDDAAAPSGGVLPAGDLGWVDGLDDKALDRAEQWLETRQGPSPSPGPGPSPGRGKKS